MSDLSGPVLRALAGLTDGCGRTLVISGPPYSGKSDAIGELRTRLEAMGSHVVTIRGTYREREVPYAALSGLGDESSIASEPARVAENEEGAEGPQNDGPIPPNPLAFLPADEGEPRGRGSARRRGTILGRTYVTPARSAEVRDAVDYWRGLVRGFTSSHRSVAIVVEDAAYVDAESREFLLYLVDRARLRPLLLVFSIDTQVPASTAWEERLAKRGDVDWVRFGRPKPDARELRRFKESFDALPETARRALSYLSLMGGSTSEVNLARVARRSGRSLASILRPALDAGLVKVEGGRVQMGHAAWGSIVIELLSPDTKSEMHRELAEALAALNPEPSLERRLELAQHYLGWYRGPQSLRFLVATVDLAERNDQFDICCELLGEALSCLPALPSAERGPLGAELRLRIAKSLFSAGRPTEGERMLREGLTMALQGGIPPATLEEWVEALVPALRSVGPRPALLAELVELADRCQAAEAYAVEVLLQSVIAEGEVERNRAEVAHTEAKRALRLARRVGPGEVQAVALMVAVRSMIDGTSVERALAKRFLALVHSILDGSGYLRLQERLEELDARWFESEGDRAAAMRVRERAIPVVRRIPAPHLELEQQLGLAALLLEAPLDSRAPAALKRAREITEQLHLVPPAPSLIRLWLLEGRLEAARSVPNEARDRWQAIVDLPTAATPPRLRAEAAWRRAELEVSAGHPTDARPYLDLIAEPELAGCLRTEWLESIGSLRRAAGLADPAYPSDPASPAST